MWIFIKKLLGQANDWVGGHLLFIIVAALLRLGLYSFFSSLVSTRHYLTEKFVACYLIWSMAVLTIAVAAIIWCFGVIRTSTLKKFVVLGIWARLITWVYFYFYLSREY